MRIKTFLIIVASLIAAATIYLIVIDNWERNTPPAATDKLRVVTSFYPLYYFASQIAGDKAEVHNITPAGAEPHDYEPTAQDMARIENSQLLILNGGKLEAWEDKVRDTLKGTNARLAVVSDVIANEQTAENRKIVRDPHIWLDPVLAKKMAAAIADNMIAADIHNTAYYESRVAQLQAKLGALDQLYRQGLGDCKQKNIVTSHAAFSYLAREYGLGQIAISGLSPEADPTAKELADIADFVKQNKITHIFFETLAGPKLAETIADETGAQTLALNPLEGLTDKEIAGGQDYFTVMEKNLLNLQIALNCK